MGVWSNSMEGALFNALMNILFQIGGRVSEGCTLTKNDIVAVVRFISNQEIILIYANVFLH